MKHRKTIILIDDEQAFADAFVAKLDGWDVDYDVITNRTFADITEDRFACFVDEVHELLEANREDCAAVFLDLGLSSSQTETPWKSGFKLGKELRAEFYELPFLVLTGWNETTVLAEGFFYDFDAYIGKSEFGTYRTEEFLGTLLRAMRKREAVVENLSLYYAKHLERTGGQPRVGTTERRNTKPRMFVGSSVEQLEMARAVHRNLDHDAEVLVWEHDVFKPTKRALESLLAELAACDFAVFVFAPDDVVSMRDRTHAAVRDNVIFESGLFIGSLGPEGVFLVTPRDAENLVLPTDFLGITPLTYDANRSDKNLRAALGPACDQMRDVIQSWKEGRR